MEQFKSLVRNIVTKGVVKQDRTGTGTISYFGDQQRYNLLEGFPLLTLKKTHMKSIVHELLWFISGSTNNWDLNDVGVTIWDEWANEYGELGPIYGAQWNAWQSPAQKDSRSLWARLKSAWKGEPTPTVPINQLQYVIDTLRNNPKSRRIIVSGWNPGVLPIEGVSHAENVANGRQVLPPCHLLFQFDASPIRWEDRVNHLVSVGRLQSFDKTIEAMKWALRGATEETIDQMRQEWLDVYFEEDDLQGWETIPQYKYKLNCQLYQRSADTLVGVPFNIASYALLTMMIAQCVDMLPGDFIHTVGDAHIYLNHMEHVNEILEREEYPLPTLKLNPEIKDLWAFTYDDIEVENYVSHPAIKLEIAV